MYEEIYKLVTAVGARIADKVLRIFRGGSRAFTEKSRYCKTVFLPNQKIHRFKQTSEYVEGYWLI